MMRPTVVFVALIVFMMCFGAAALVFAQSAPYFQGKTIMLIQGREPGGTGALRTQALIPFLRKYIPGEPIIVTQFMPGGGGRKATNYISRNAKPDGLTIGNVGSGLVANAVLGSTGVEYDIDKLIYLGAANSTAQYVFNSVAKLGLDSIDKLRARSGFTRRRTDRGPRHLHQRQTVFLAPRPQGTEICHRIFRSRARFGHDGRRAGCSGQYSGHHSSEIAGVSSKRNSSTFTPSFKFPRKIAIPIPRLPNSLSSRTFAKSDREKKIMTMFRTFRLVGSPYILPPGTPQEPVSILREAMRKTFKDPAFLKEFKRLSADDATPLLPEEQEKAIKEIPRDTEIVALFNKLAGNDPLPSR